MTKFKNKNKKKNNKHNNNKTNKNKNELKCLYNNGIISKTMNQEKQIKRTHFLLDNT